MLYFVKRSLYLRGRPYSTALSGGLRSRGSGRPHRLLRTAAFRWSGFARFGRLRRALQFCVAAFIISAIYGRKHAGAKEERVRYIDFYLEEGVVISRH